MPERIHSKMKTTRPICCDYYAIVGQLFQLWTENTEYTRNVAGGPKFGKEKGKMFVNVPRYVEDQKGIQ